MSRTLIGILMILIAAGCSKKTQEVKPIQMKPDSVATNASITKEPMSNQTLKPMKLAKETISNLLNKATDTTVDTIHVTIGVNDTGCRGIEIDSSTSVVIRGNFPEDNDWPDNYYLLFKFRIDSVYSCILLKRPMYFNIRLIVINTKDTTAYACTTPYAPLLVYGDFHDAEDFEIIESWVISNPTFTIWKRQFSGGYAVNEKTSKEELVLSSDSLFKIQLLPGPELKMAVIYDSLYLNLFHIKATEKL
jgi:hypothetical protein